MADEPGPKDEQGKGEPVEPLICPGCQRKLNVRLEHVGKKVRCPKCGATSLVPARIFRRDSLRAEADAQPRASVTETPTTTGQLHAPMPVVRPVSPPGDDNTIPLMDAPAASPPGSAPASGPTSSLLESPSGISLAAGTTAHVPPPSSGAPSRDGLEDLWDSDGTHVPAPEYLPPPLHSYLSVPAESASSPSGGAPRPTVESAAAGADPASTMSAQDDDAYTLDLSSLPEELRRPGVTPAMAGLEPAPAGAVMPDPLMPPANGLPVDVGGYSLATPLPSPSSGDAAPSTLPGVPSRPKVYERMAADQARRERETEAAPLPNRPFVQGVVDFLFQPDVLVRLGVVVIGSWAAGALVALFTLALMAGGALMAVGVIIMVSAIVAVIYLAIYVCGLMVPIIDDTAAGAHEITFPVLSMGERVIHLMHIGVPWCAGGVVGWLVGFLMFGWAGREIRTLVMLGVVFLVFPIFLMSMSASQSMLQIISSRVLASLVRQSKVWLRFYLASSLLIFPQALFMLALLIMPPLVQVAGMIFFGGIFIGMGALVYARLLGRLAHIVSLHAVDHEADEES